MDSSDEGKLEYVRAVDPRVDIHPGGRYGIVTGSKQVSQQNYPTTSVSNSQFTWNVTTPSTWTVVDRHIKLRAQVQITFSGAAPTLGVTDGLRQFPLNSIIQVLNVQINGAATTISPADYIKQLMRYGNDKKEREHFLSGSASMADQYQQYSDWATYGSARNPLAQYGEVGQEQSRGAILPDYVSVDGKTLVYTLTEPLLGLSPFLFSSEEWNGFINVSQILVTATLNQNLSLIWSHDAINGPAIGTVTVSFVSPLVAAPQLLVTYLSPQDTMKIPAQVIYPYNSLVEYIKGGFASIPALPAQPTPPTPVVLASDAIRLDQVPKRVYLFAKKQRSDLTFNDSDACLAITNVNITFNNVTGLLAAATPQDLYYMSVTAGYNQSWAQWSRFTGSVFACDFGDGAIGLPPQFASGSKGQFMFQAAVTVVNMAAAAIVPELFIVVANEGVFIINEGTAIPQIGILDAKTVLDTARVVPYYQYHQQVGAGFFSKVKHFLNRAAKYAKPIAEAVSAIPGLEEHGALASAIADKAAELTGGAMHRRRGRAMHVKPMHGGALAQGGAVKREDLLRR